jgi:ribose transport system permease protein
MDTVPQESKKMINKDYIRILIDNAKNSMVFIALIVLFVVFSLTLSNVGKGFASPDNLWNIIRQTSLIAILSVGMSFALAAGQIDLSVGAVVAVTGLTSSLVLRSFGILPAILAGLSVGAIIGALNGFLAAYVGMPAFLATLGTMITFQGVARTMTELKSIPITNQTFIFIFGGGDFRNIPVLVIWMLLFLIIGHIMLRKMPFGRKALAIGGNRRSALYSGINVKRTIFAVMVFSGVLAAIAGILWAGWYGGGRYTIGDGSELSAIAASVLGGTSIMGGIASILGAGAGAIMIGMINTALVMYGLDVYQQMIVRGIVIIIAVAATQRRKGI